MFLKKLAITGALLSSMSVVTDVLADPTSGDLDYVSISALAILDLSLYVSTPSDGYMALLVTASDDTPTGDMTALHAVCNIGFDLVAVRISDGVLAKSIYASATAAQMTKSRVQIHWVRAAATETEVADPFCRITSIIVVSE